jgi:putative transcription factor
MRIRNARIIKGYKTQKELANVINERSDIIADYESGKAVPNNTVLQKLRRVLKTKL